MGQAGVRGARAGSGLTEYETLPVGVVVVKTYRSGMTQLSCAHAPQHQYPTGGYVYWLADSDDPVHFDEVSNEEEAHRLVPEGATLDYGGIIRCRVCGGDENTTDCFRLPVRMLGRVAKAAQRSQDVLF